MKKLTFLASFLLLCCVTILTSCSQTPAEQVVGHWKIELGEGNRIDVTINDDATTGQINMSGPDGYGRNMLFLREDFTIEEDGDDLILIYNDGSKGSLLVRDGVLCTPDGAPYTKVD